MPWFNVDDSFHSHPKVLATEPAALGLWVIAGSWSSANRTDGLVPDHVLPRLLPDSVKLARTLVTAGLWRRVQGGYTFHDWTDWNLSREQIEHKRKQNAERQRRHRDSHKNESTPPNGVTQDVTRDVTRDGRVSHGAQSNPRLSVVDVDNQSSRRNARSDLVIDQIITTIYETTNRVIDADWAEKIAGHILYSNKAGNPVAYVKAVIENEPDPFGRFLPIGGTA